MAEYQVLIQTLALTLGVAWASGLNLYAAVMTLGLAGNLGYIELPEGLQVVEDPMVILAAGLMYCVEFVADKVPGVDTGWDTLHTFIRIPAGAILAASAAGNVDPALAVAAGLLGGTVTAATHAGKAGTRMVANASPEPFSNWGLSVAEDAAVFAGLWAAVAHPVVFLIAFAIFAVALCFLLPKLARAITALVRRVGSWLGMTRPSETTTNSSTTLERLQTLRAQGVLTAQEYETARLRIAT